MSLRITTNTVQAVLLPGATDRDYGRFFAAQARLLAAEIQQSNDAIIGSPVPREQLVDLRANAPLESVRPGGEIRFIWRFTAQVARAAWILVHRLAPVRTGKYRRNFVMEADGVPVIGPDSPAVVKASEIIIYNRLIYARRLEPSWGGARVSALAPGGIFQAAVPLLQRQFRTVTVRFSFRDRGSIRVPMLIISPRAR